jgi:fructose-specific phosphotransferase system IIC component
VVPLAGAGGGAFFYFMSRFGHHGAWVKWIARIVGVFGFIIALWIGTVLGLDGTLWD